MPTVLINSTAAKAGAQLMGLASRIPSGIKAGLDAGGEVGLEEKELAIVDPTYTTPITIGPRSGRPLWERERKWLGGQVVQASPMRRVVTTVGKAEAYERALGFLNTSKRDGINRSNKAADRARPKIRIRAIIAFVREFNRTVGI